MLETWVTPAGLGMERPGGAEELDPQIVTLERQDVERA